MKNKNIMFLYEGLISLKQRDDLKFSAKVAYSIIRNIKILEPIYQDILSIRINVLGQHGTESKENPGYWDIIEGHIEATYDELCKIDNIENNNITLYTITLDDIKDLTISIEDMQILSLMLEE